MSEAMRMAVTPIKKAMRVALKGHRVTGNLRKSIVDRVRRYGRGYIVGVVGPSWFLGRHSHLVEHGTKPRYTKKGASRGTMPAIPFAQSAYKSTRKQVEVRLRRKIFEIIDRLVRQGKIGV
jgi:hypothetical protein